MDNQSSKGGSTDSTKKGGEDLVDEKIDERILRLLELEYIFDIDYDTYASLLKEKMVAARMAKTQIPTEEAELLTNEYKKIKGKKGRFKVKKITADSFKKGSAVGINLGKQNLLIGKSQLALPLVPDKITKENDIKQIIDTLKGSTDSTKKGEEDFGKKITADSFKKESAVGINLGLEKDLGKQNLLIGKSQLALPPAPDKITEEDDIKQIADTLKGSTDPTKKGKEDLVDEKIDERILRLLELEYIFDIDYDTYASLLKEKMVAARMAKTQIPTEEAELLTNEYKKIKGKKGRFKVKKITADSFKKGSAVGINLGKQNLLIGKSQLALPPASDKMTEGDDIKQIIDALAEIIKNLTIQNKLTKSAAEKSRIAGEARQRSEKESRLEKGFKSAIKVAEKIIAPVKSLLQRIIDFFVAIFIGRALIKLLNWFSDKKNQDKIRAIGRFLGDHWPKLLALYIIFGTGLGKFVRSLTKIIFRGGGRLAAAAVGLAAKAGVGKAKGAAKFLGKYGKLIGTGLEVAATVGTTMAVSKGIEDFGGIGEEEKPKTQGLAGGGFVIPRFSGGGFNLKGMMGGAAMGAMFGPLGMLLGGALGSGKPQKIFSGFVSGEKGVDKVPAMLSDGEFVMSRGAVQKYGVDTLESMNAAGGGTNRPKMMGGKTYAAGGGLIFGDSIASGYAGRSGGNQVLIKDARGMSMVGASPSQVLNQLISYGKGKFKDQTVHLSSGITNNNSDLANVESQLKFLRDSGAKIKLLGVTNKPPADLQKGLGNMNSTLKALANKYGASFSGGFTPSSDGIHPANYSSFNFSSPSQSNSAESSSVDSQPSSSNDMQFTPSASGESLGLSSPYSEPSESFTPNIEPPQQKSNSKPKPQPKPKKGVTYKLDLFQRDAMGNKSLVKGGTTGFGTTYKNRQSIIVPNAARTGWEPEITIGGMRYFGQVRGKDVIYSSFFAPRGRFGSAIKGGFGLKDESFKDAPKTQIMTDDNGRPFIGYKTMKNGKLHYARRQEPPTPGTGTSNPLEALGRFINPKAYQTNDAKLALEKTEREKRIAQVNSLESLQRRGASVDTQNRMMKQIGANLSQTQNDLKYRKIEQKKYSDKVIKGTIKPKVTVIFGDIPKKGSFNPNSSSGSSPMVPSFSSTHPKNEIRRQLLAILGVK
jgi:hypothetical protein